MISFDPRAPIPDSTICIAYHDTTYPKWGDDPAPSRNLKARIEVETGYRLEEVDIYPGASGPGWLLELPTESLAIGAATLTLLFSGKPLKESLESWSQIAQWIRKLLIRPACLSRSAAASLAIDEIFAVTGQSQANQITLLSYSQADRRYQEWRDATVVEGATPLEPLSVTIHVFEFDIDGTQFTVIVDGTDVGVCRGGELLRK